jgi:hypothetical protein
MTPSMWRRSSGEDVHDHLDRYSGSIAVSCKWFGLVFWYRLLLLLQMRDAA